MKTIKIILLTLLVVVVFGGAFLVYMRVQKVNRAIINVAQRTATIETYIAEGIKQGFLPGVKQAEPSAPLEAPVE